MGSDLFGSFAESTCAALVVMANTSDLIKNPDVLYYPLMISAIGIICCFFTTIYGLYFNPVNEIKQIE